MTATTLLAIALIVLTAGLGGIGWAVRRQVARNDTIDKTLSEHTVALAQLATSVAALSTAQTQVFDDTEELDDAVQQLQLATAILRERMGAHEKYRAARDTPEEDGAMR